MDVCCLEVEEEEEGRVVDGERGPRRGDARGIGGKARRGGQGGCRGAGGEEEWGGCRVRIARSRAGAWACTMCQARRLEEGRLTLVLTFCINYTSN